MGNVKIMTTLLTLFLGACLLQLSDCSTYHVVLLRTPANSVTNLGSLWASAPTGATPTVTAIGSDGCSVTVALNAASPIPAATCPTLVPTGTGQYSGGLRVSSDADFKLHVVQEDVQGNKEGYLALNDDQLGTEYVVITYCTIGGTCQFSVTAVADGTSVYVKFKEGVTAVASCPSENGIPFTLNELDVLYFESSQDLTGTVVSASDKIGVFGGSYGVPASAQAFGGTGSTSFMIEQLIPTNRWGKTFYVMPHVQNEAGDLVKIVSKTNNTLAHIKGYSPSVIQRAGDSIERRIDWNMATEIRTSNPAQVVQLLNVDLYSQQIYGQPSMVLVQADTQWTRENAFGCSSEQIPGETGHETFVYMAKDSATQETLAGLVGSPGEPIAETDKFSAEHIATNPPSPIHFYTTTPRFGGYGYCAYSAAMLLGIDLTDEAEECAPSPSQPGDDRDNDCDGEIDEDTCDETDLSQSFSLDALGAADTVKELPVDGTNNLEVKVRACGLVQIRLKSSFDPSFFDFQITPESVTLTNCPDGVCEYGNSETAPATADCTTGGNYHLSWNVGDTETTIDVQLQGANTLSKTFTTPPERYDTVTFASLVFQANFTVDMMVKDCRKMPEDDTADNYGHQFIVPVSNADTDFTLFVTLKTGQPASNIKVISSDVPQVRPGPSVSKSEIDALFPSYDHLELESTEEVSVYLHRETSAGNSGLYLLPTDILGPGYFHMPTDSLDTTGTNAIVYSWHNSITFLGNADPSETSERVKEITSLSEDTFLMAEQPIAVFRGTAAHVRAQMPPRETLGKQFYVPALDLASLSATAIIRFIATEDSTVIIIRGDYDNLDTTLYVGQTSQVDRTVVSGRIYDVTSNKPAQLHLEILDTTSSPNTKILLVVPPVEQYTNVSNFPSFGVSSAFTFLSSTGIFANGTEMAAADMPVSTGPSPMTFSHLDPFFYITFLSSSGNGHIAVPSDAKYVDINEPCRICLLPDEFSDVTRDCDCDGLVKEEEDCNGTDTDIDGAINEDCPVYIPEASVSISLSSTSVDCSIVDTTTTTTPAAPPATPPTPTIPANIVAPTIEVDQEPSFSELTSTGKEIIIESTTESPDGTTSAPVEETCTEDCMCPCGWVNVQNYTQEELEQVVEEIQERLKLNKLELSSLVRKKTSAQDDRPSAKAVGSVGIVFFVFTIGFIVLLDLTSLARDLRLLRDNLRSICPI